MDRMLDFHNHLMPGVDDGAQTIQQALEGLAALAADGVKNVITTPHVDGSLTLEPAELELRLAELDAAWAVVSPRARAEQPGVTLHRGVELMLDTPEPRLDDPRLHLNGGPFVLMEFPFMAIPPRSSEVIKSLRQKNCIPIIAHPERYAGFSPDGSMAEQWRKNGAYLQVNGPSLLGNYGPEPRRIAFLLLERGWADYLCSDYHSRGRSPVRAYRELLEEMGASEQAQLLTETNPRRVLAGEPPLPVPALPLRPTFWKRVTEIFRSA